jgi:hypothetical protein
VAHRSHHGPVDSVFGISMFWSEKFSILVMYLQRLALLLLWNLQWPTLFYKRMDFVFGFLLDVTAHHEGVDSLGAGTMFEGCDTICKIVWPLGSLGMLALWSCIALSADMPLYYTRNIERATWVFIRMGYLPFMNTLMRYFIRNEDGNLDKVVWKWVTPVSELGVIMALLTMSVVVVLGIVRSAKQVLFKSRIRHASFIAARELEYKLKFSCMYRNERLWMISSYNYGAWPWSIVRVILDTLLLINMTWVPVEYGVFVGWLLLILIFLYPLMVSDVHRCWSSNMLENWLNLILALFCTFGVLQVNGVRNALLVDNNLDYFLFAMHGGGIAVYLLLCVYFFASGHVMHGINKSTATKRAEKKWQHTFYDGEEEANEGWVTMKLNKSMEYKPEEDDDMAGEAWNQQLQRDTVEQSYDRFYIPKKGRMFDIDTSSPHVWPINNSTINELLRRNDDDHLIDTLRAARKILDRISALHNTPVLIPTDELKTHIGRLQECLVFTKRGRITHHANSIHPLQTTFEDLIEQFTYELRVFSGQSVTVGHNARKMIEVSRYLATRMIKRDRALALLSPMMRRILMKLFALRVFIELVEDRPDYLLPGKHGAEKPFADLGGDTDSDNPDDIQSQQSGESGGKPFAGYDVFGQVSDAMAEYDHGDEGLQDDSGDEAEDNDHEARLAGLLANKGPSPGVEDRRATSEGL